MNIILLIWELLVWCGYIALMTIILEITRWLELKLKVAWIYDVFWVCFCQILHFMYGLLFLAVNFKDWI